MSGTFLQMSRSSGHAPHASWFEYAPCTLRVHSPGMGTDFCASALIFFAVTTMGGAIISRVTILHMRVPGIAISRIPLFPYSTLTVSRVILAALGAWAQIDPVWVHGPYMAVGIVLSDRWFGFHYVQFIAA
jgi:heme/copper-type cytochrome/quinol oxidase subunit 1